MFPRTVVAFLAVLTLCAASSDEELAPDKLKFSIYYDAADKASDDFIALQLSKTYATLGSDWLDVQLVPFGKYSNDSNDPTDICSSSNQSCELNKYAACGVHILQKNLDKLATFGVCAALLGEAELMKDSTCARILHLNQLSGLDPYDCAVSPGGDQLLKYMRTLTPQHIPYIPLVYVNGVEPPQKDIPKIRKNLLGYACKKLKNKPLQCQKRYGEELDL